MDAPQPSSSRFSKEMPKEVIQRAKQNDPSLVKIDFTGETVFQLRSVEYCVSLREALSGNQYVKELVLQNCELTDLCAIELGELLQTNNTIVLLDLTNNRITNSGVVAIAKGLANNKCLLQLSILNQGGAFGETCLSEFMRMFETNITLQKITWRLDSRQSFALNKMLSRNVEISRRRSTNREFGDILPQAIRDYLASENGSDSSTFAQPTRPERGAEVSNLENTDDNDNDNDNDNNSSSNNNYGDSNTVDKDSATAGLGALALEDKEGSQQEGTATAATATRSINADDSDLVDGDFSHLPAAGANRKSSLAVLRDSGAVSNLKSMFQ